MKRILTTNFAALALIAATSVWGGEVHTSAQFAGAKVRKGTVDGVILRRQPAVFS